MLRAELRRMTREGTKRSRVGAIIGQSGQFYADPIVTGLIESKATPSSHSGRAQSSLRDDSGFIIALTVELRG